MCAAIYDVFINGIRLSWLLGPVSIFIGLVSVVWCSFVSHFYNLSVVRPSWTGSMLPYENALYILFSVSVSDVIQSICMATSGLRMVLASSFPLYLHKLNLLVLLLSKTVRNLLLVCLSVRLLTKQHWSPTLKIALISLIWVFSVTISFLLCYNLPLEIMELDNEVRFLTVIIWRYSIVEILGILALPIACILLHRINHNAEVDLQSNFKLNVFSSSVDTGNRFLVEPTDYFNSRDPPTREQLRRVTDLKRQAYIDTWYQSRGPSSVPRACPSRFTISNMWRIDSDEVDMDADPGDAPADDFQSVSLEQTPNQRDKHRDHVPYIVALHIRARVYRFVVVLLLVQSLFSALSTVVHVLGDTFDQRPDSEQIPSHSPAKLHITLITLEELLNTQPLINVIVFSSMFGGFCRYLRQHRKRRATVTKKQPEAPVE